MNLIPTMRKKDTSRGQQASPSPAPQVDQAANQFSLKGTTPTTPSFDMNLGMPASLSIPNQLTPTKPTQPATTLQSDGIPSPAPDSIQGGTSSMQDQLNAIKKQALGIQESIGQMESTPEQPVGDPTTPTDTTTPPVAPVISEDTQNAIDSAEKAILKAQKLSPQEITTQEDIDKLIESTREAYINTRNQPIPLEFITGQLASIEDRALSLAEPLENKMARLQAQRQANLNASKFALERADDQAIREREGVDERETQVFNLATTLVRSGASQDQLKSVLDSKSIKEALSNAAKTGLLQPNAEGGFTLSDNQTRFDSEGNIVATTIGREGLSGLGVGSAGDPAEYQVGDNPIVDSWVENINMGRVEMHDVPDELQNLVSNALAAGGAETNQVKVVALQDKIVNIESLINSRGMAKAVGPIGLARWTPFKLDHLTGDVQDFIAGIHNLTSKETLQFLIDIKAQGARFGALSNQELIVLKESATKINDWEIKNEHGEPTGKWNITENKFKEELQRIKMLAQRALNRATGVEELPEEAMEERPQQLQMPDGSILEMQPDGTYE